MAKQPKKPEQVNNKIFVCLNRQTGIVFKLPGDKKVVINGNAAKLRGLEKGTLPVGAYGMTLVDQEDWQYIKNTYGQMEIFKNNLIFASEKRSDAIDESDEKSELRHGLEPVDTNQPETKPAGGEAA